MNVILPTDASVPDLIFIVACVFSLFFGFLTGLVAK